MKMKKKGLVGLLATAMLLAGLLVPAAVVADPDPGIVGLWHFDGDATDSSGNDNHGTLQGGATYATGMFGQALSLDGSDDYVELTANLAITTAITVEAWINPDTLGDYEAIVSNFEWPTNPEGFSFRVMANGKLVWRAVLSGDNTYSITSDTTLETGKWYHVAVTHDASYTRLYIDGSQDKEETPGGTIVNISKVPKIGWDDYATARVFDGLIDEVRIWDSVYADFEVTAAPLTGINPVTTPAADHTVTATVDPVAPGVTVGLEVTAGPNVGETVSGQTDANGQVTLSYTGDGGAGTDTISVWVDNNWNGSYDASIDYVFTVEKSWVASFVTGGGSYASSGKKPQYTWGGTVGYLPDLSLVGQLQLVDHANKVAYHINSFSALSFSRGPNAPAESPYAYYDTATFTGTGWGNDGSSVSVIVTIVDNGEGKGKNAPPPDTIAVTGTTTNPAGSFGFNGNLVGGNMQVHEGYKD